MAPLKKGGIIGILPEVQTLREVIDPLRDLFQEAYRHESVPALCRLNSSDDEKQG